MNLDADATVVTRRVVLAAGPLALLACAAKPPPLPPGPGARELAGASFVLLGEVHDNAAHHQLRSELLAQLLVDRRQTVVLFEPMGAMHDGSLRAALEPWARRAPQDWTAGSLTEVADTIADAGRLDRRAWGWPLHRPVVEAAVRFGATIRGANLEPDMARAVVRQGLAAAPAEVRDAIGRDRSWTPDQQATLERAIEVGHCHALPASLIGPMVLAQRARDAAMALAMQRAARDLPGARVVLIAGNGHVRRDVGVPHVLRSLGVEAATMVTVGYLEPGGARDGFDHIGLAYPPPHRPDPCAALQRPR
jgi:uncharacterized iron-regulated protein